MPKLLKQFKQVKGIKNLPRPFINTIDPANVEILEYSL